MARIAGNLVFESVLRTIYDNINKYFDRFLPRKDMISQRTYEDLSDIFEAIEAKDSDMIKMLVQKHIRWFNKIMEKERKNNPYTDRNMIKEVSYEKS